MVAGSLPELAEDGAAVLGWTAATIMVAVLLAMLAATRRKGARLACRLEDLQHEIGVRECVERQLQASQSNLQLATETSGVGTWYWDLGTDEVACSPQALKLFGFSEPTKSYKMKQFFAAVHPDDQDRLQSVIAKAFREGGQYHSDYRVIRPDGAVVWISSTARALEDSDGKVRRMTGISADVTEYKQLEESFYQAQKMEAVGRLAGGVAHDFNNMLGVISAYAELLREDPGLPGNARQRVDEIMTATERANALTRQLLAFSRKQVINPTVLDLNAVIVGVKDMMQRLVGNGINIAATLSDGSPLIKADRGQLEQLLLNFATNSRDAMPKGGRFELKTTFQPAPSESHMPQGDCVCLEVCDTGEGMPPEVMKHIFEPFFTTKAAGKGTGLGLASAYGVIEQAQGTITVESKVGNGTTFRIYLPAIAGTAEPTQARKKPAAVASAKVLLVEDEPSLREVLTEFIRSAGMQVTSVSSAQEAIARLDAGESLDVLLTDLVMPAMDGRSLAQAARSKRPNLHIIYMSGHTDDTLLQRELMSDGLPYLQKPFSRGDLINKLNDVLRPAV
jgi:two-component system, cell cycle sensor histidine kinase and response regulator CckA